MTERNDDSQKFVEQARAALLEAENHTPVAVNERLAAARHAAVAEVDRPPGVHWGKFAGAGALASAALVLVLVLPRLGTESLPLLEEAEMAAAQDVELLEELEFVAWMLAEETPDDAPGQG